MGGPILVFIFSISQAARDVYFPYLFENHGFFDIVLIAFFIATIFGWIVLLSKEPEQIPKILKQWKLLTIASMATAGGWICYFFALNHIEAAIANALFSGAGPFVVILASYFGSGNQQTFVSKRLERFCYVGLFATLVAIVFVAVSGRSGLSQTLPREAFFGSLAALSSGALMAASMLISRRLNESGVSANAVIAARFIVGVLVATLIIMMQEQPSGIGFDKATLVVLMAAFCLIVLPGYALQIGVSRTAPLTVQVIVPLSPILVFAAQLLDERTHYSAATLICVVFYGIFILSANVLRGWRDEPSNKNELAIVSKRSEIAVEKLSRVVPLSDTDRNKQ